MTPKSVTSDCLVVSIIAVMLLAITVITSSAAAVPSSDRIELVQRRGMFSVFAQLEKVLDRDPTTRRPSSSVDEAALNSAQQQEQEERLSDRLRAIALAVEATVRKNRLLILKPQRSIDWQKSVQKSSQFLDCFFSPIQCTIKTRRSADDSLSNENV